VDVDDQVVDVFAVLAGENRESEEFFHVQSFSDPAGELVSGAGAAGRAARAAERRMIKDEKGRDARENESHHDEQAENAPVESMRHG
jgi:hypothetical protein